MGGQDDTHDAQSQGEDSHTRTDSDNQSDVQTDNLPESHDLADAREHSIFVYAFPTFSSLAHCKPVCMSTDSGKRIWSNYMTYPSILDDKLIFEPTNTYSKVYNIGYRIRIQSCPWRMPEGAS